MKKTTFFKNAIFTMVLFFTMTLSAKLKAEVINNPNFTVAANGVTCLCENAAVGESGTLIINGVEKTFTKRTEAQLKALFRGTSNPPQVALTCTSGITNMSKLFWGAWFNQDIGSWDVSSVTNMSQMFEQAQLFNQDIGSWDVSSVTNMSRMFYVAKRFNQNIGSWDVSKVTDMSLMFGYAQAFNGDIGSWDTSKVTEIESMFVKTFAFNQDIGDWDVSNVTNMSRVFNGARAFNGDIGAWDVSKVTNMSLMFHTAPAFNQNIGSWDVSKVTSMQGMFAYAQAFNGDIGAWDVSKVTDMRTMFGFAWAFNQDIGSWDVSKVTYMSTMFWDARAFNQNIGSWDVSNVTNMSRVFDGARAFNGDIGSWDMSKVTTMENMFLGAYAFNQNIGDWDVSKVTTMKDMFLGARAFNQNIGDWDVSKVTTMGSILNYTGLSHTNYDALLTGWSQQVVQRNVVLRARGLTYCSGKRARQRLINSYGWKITEDRQGRIGSGECALPVTVTTQPTSQSITYGADARFTVAATGDNLTYKWQENSGSGFVDIVDGGVYSNATTATLTIIKPTAAMSNNQYRVVISAGPGATVTSDGNPTLLVDKKALEVIAVDQNKEYGSSYSYLGTEFTTDGLANSDTVISATITSDGSVATAAVGGYEINISGAVGTGLSNYEITYTNKTLTVDKKALLITAVTQSKEYGSSYSYLGTEFTTDGLANSDTVTSATITSDGSVATATVGDYEINISAAVGTGLSNYEITYTNKTLSVVDVTNPIAIAQDITVQLDADGNATIIASDIDNGSSDDSGNMTLSLDETTFNCENINDVSNKYSLNFDGINDYVQLPGTWGGTGFSELTVEAWVYNDGTTGDFQAIASSPSFSFLHFQMATGGNNAVYTNGGDIQLPIISQTPLQTWKHVAIVIKSGNSRVYVNGVQLGDASGVTFNNLLSTNNFSIGRGYNGGRFMKGSIDELRIWNVARSQADISTNMNTSLLGTEPGLFAYYDFEDGPNSGVLTDRTGNGNNGALVNMDNANDWIAGANSLVKIGSPVILTVTDSSNNSSTTTANVTVLDEILPVITAPNMISANATSAAGAVVNYTTPVGTDNCSVTTAMTAGLATGAIFPIGTTVVTYVATDGSGHTALASFNVEVVGITPVIAVPSNITVNTDANQCGAIVPFAATDATGIPNSVITYDVQPNSLFEVGNTTVTATATNAVGTAILTFDVTVVDNEAPTIALNGDATLTHNAFTAYTDAGASATDNCGTLNVSVGGDVVDVNTVGSYIITYNAEDASGNNATQVIRTVNVVDVTNPIAIAQDITVQLDANGNATIIASDIDNGSSDDSGNVTLSLDTTTFDCDDIIGDNNLTDLVYKTTSSNGNQSHQGQLGMEFNLTSTITINSLGAFDHNLDGISGLIRVGIFNRDTKTVIPGLEVSISGSNDQLINNHRVRFMTPVVLEPGNYLITAKGFNRIDLNGNGQNSSKSTDNVGGAIQFVGGGVYSRDYNINNFDYPTVADGGPTNRYISGTFGYGSVSANEVTLTVTDAEGNFLTAAANVTVLDEISPKITAPETISTVATSADGAVVNYTTPVGTDNCSVTTAMTSGLADGSTFPIGTTVVTYVATDGSGNDASASFNVEVVGIAPVIAVPANITANTDANECGAIVSFAAADETGIPNSVITYDIQPNSLFEVGNTTVTATATNAVGTAILTFDVTVIDDIKPEIAAPNNISTAATSAQGTIVNYTTPVGTDNCSVTTEMTAGLADGSTFPIGTTEVTYVATDGSGNTALASFNIEVVGIIPVIAVPSNITVNTDANQCGAIVPFVATDATGIPNSLVTYNKQPNSVFEVGTTTITATATNAVGTAILTFDVTVVDNEIPIITLNNAATLTHNAFTAYTDAGASADDNCGTPNVSVGGDVVDVNTVGSYVITYDAVDASGNNATQVIRTVNVVDVTNPIAIAQDITVQLDANGNATIIASDIDNGSSDDSGNMTLNLDETTFNCDHLGGIGSGVNSLTFAPNGSRLLTNHNNILNGGSTFTMEAWVNPSGNGNARIGGIIVNKENEYEMARFPDGNLKYAFSNANPGWRWIDTGINLPLNEWNHVSITFNNGQIRAYKNGVLVHSYNGNGAMIARSEVFTVGNRSFNQEFEGDIDEVRIWNVARTAQAIQADYATALKGTEAGLTLYYPMEEGSGNVVNNLAGGGLNGTISGLQWNTNPAPIQSSGNEVTLTVTDAEGNFSTATAIVTVLDEISPKITATETISTVATSAAGALVNYTTPVGTDNCSVTTAMTAGLADGATFPIGTTVVTYVATDGSGNTALASFNVVVVGIAPVIAVPVNITVNTDASECGALVPFAATDATGIPNSVITYDIQPNSLFELGTTTVTATATNAVGTAILTFDVTVIDDIKPEIAAPNNISTVATSAQGAVVNYTTPVGTDNCSVTTAITAGLADGATFPIGTTAVTYTATDGSGNIASASFNVEVVGIAPVIMVPANITVNTDANECGAIVPFAATDATGIPNSVITYDIQPNSLFEVGKTTVTATATNAVGTAISTFDVTVIDNQVPKAIAKDITVTLDENGSAIITADDIDNDSSDNCTYTPSLDVTTFDCTNIGIQNTVILTVTDASGNKDSTTANVTILEHFKETLDLRSLSSFEAFTGTGAVTNSGNFTGNVGTNVGALTGFTGPNFNGSIHFNDALTAQAELDLLKVYIHLNNIPVTHPSANNAAHAPAFGSGEVLTPGVYDIGGAGSVAGTLTLNGQGDPNAVFIMKFKGAFTAGAASNIVLINGADAANVFWVAQGALSVGANSTIKGTLLAYPGAITLGVNSSIEGRLLSSVGAITVGVGGTASMPGTMNIPINPMISYTPAAAVDVLGSIENFSLFTSNGAVANAATSGILGDVGADVGAISGFATSAHIGSFYNSDAVTAQAKIDLDNAYTQLMSIPTTVPNHTPAFGSGETLEPGVYSTPGAGSLVGIITLDGQNNPDAIFIFKFNGAFAAAAQSKVILSNGTRRCNVFWISEGAASIGSFSMIKGTVIAHGGAATMGAGGNLEGRLLSAGGAIGFSTGVVYTVVHDVECDTYTEQKTSIKTAVASVSDFIEETLVIYPNPSRGVFNIKLAIFNVETEIYLFDTAGKLIARKSISKENNSGNLIRIGSNNLSSGIYLVKIITKDKAVTKKVIVEKSN
jgi:surface protein